MAAFPELQVNGIRIVSFRFALGHAKEEPGMQTKNPPRRFAGGFSSSSS
jgi:hypothetical protein